MALRDELEPARIATPCSVKAWVESQTNADEWWELVDDASVQSARLIRLLRKYGYPHGDSPLQRHRKGGCKCGRAA